MMPRTHLPLLAVAAVAVAGLAVAGLTAACTSASSAPKCETYVVPVGTDLTTPSVSFKTDVMPILVQSCAFSSCHGASSGGNNGVRLGSKTAPNDPANAPSAIRANIVGVKGPELTTMNFVTPSDPSQSYLMHKLDGDHCKLDAQCRDRSCGTAMPQGGDLLPVATRDTVRRWIAQGALDD
jgi:hypothetical protein